MNIVCYPNDILRRKAAAVSVFDEKLAQLAGEMVETMHESNGLGLAAPQVGRSIRLIVLNVPDQTDGDVAMVNPEILEREGSAVSEEGCLSFPGIYINVQRAARVVVKYQDLGGHERQIEGDGLLGRALQHEVDHLDGVLLADKMNAIQRMANRRGLRMLQLKHAYRQQKAVGESE